MNERIKQLYEQSMEQHVSNNMAWEELNPEKFAELTIRDVCNKLEPVLAKEILTLYGVEE